MCRLGFRVNSNRAPNIRRLVPPGDIHPQCHNCVHECDNLELGELEVLGFSCDELDDESHRLEKNNGFGEPVAFGLVTNLGLKRENEFFLIHELIYLVYSNGANWPRGAGENM